MHSLSKSLIAGLAAAAIAGQATAHSSLRPCREVSALEARVSAAKAKLLEENPQTVSRLLSCTESFAEHAGDAEKELVRCFARVCFAESERASCLDLIGRVVQIVCDDIALDRIKSEDAACS